MNFFSLISKTSAMLLFASAGPLAAQGTDDLLTTVGTTVQKDGGNHAYLLWQPGDAAATFGKRFSINRKDGPANSPSPYQRVGMQTLQSSPNTIRAMLELGAVIDRSHAIATSRIDGLYRDVTYDVGSDPAQPDDPNLDAAGKLAHLIAAAAVEPQTLSRLFFLGRAHPGVMIALGHAYQMPVSSGVHTFEIREVNLADKDIRVVGRVTLDTAKPVQLIAPASPVRVEHPVADGSQYTVSAKDHLNARFRWGVPPRLLQQLPHAFGFDMFRVKADVAKALDWHVSPPSPNDMLTALAAMAPGDPDPDVSQVNQLPILVADMLTPAQAGDMDDQERIDYADDGIWYLGGDGRLVRRPYQDGEAFYYYVAARDIIGQPGQLSSGTLAMMCNRQAPRPPVVDSVMSRFVTPATAAQWDAEGQGGSQYLEVKIRQLPTLPASATGYHIYRWGSPQEYLNFLGNPETNRVGTVAHEPGETFVLFNDDGPGAPTLDTHEDTSVWYTARAIGVTQCSGKVVLSGHSGPMAGFLRDFKAPDAPTGDFLICRHLPSATYNRFFEVNQPGVYGLPDDYVGIIVEVDREDAAIVAADIEVTIQILPDRTEHTVHSRRHIFRQGNTLFVALPYREPTRQFEEMRISVSGVTSHGLVSSAALHQINPGESQSDIRRHLFKVDAEQYCQTISTVPDSRPVHEAYDEDGSINPIVGSISFPVDQGVHEWRVYRRVGTDGPLTLIAKAEGTDIPNPGPWEDDAIPAASGARVCYYGQVFDQNANPSPLYPIGCVEMLNPDLPTPMLAPAEVAGENDGLMLVDLEWFCDPVGVERFEVLIAREGGGIPDVEGLSQLISATAVSVESDVDEDLDFYRFNSPRVSGPALGNGPQYALTIALDANKRHHVAIRACGPGKLDGRANGASSNVVNIRWITPPPEGPQPVIPWPARPLSSSYDHRLPIDAYTMDEGPLWAGSLASNSNHATQILVGVTRDEIKDGEKELATQLFSTEPPEEALFRVRENRGNPASLSELMPFMLYRYQLPSDLYPDARPNIVQCTPLLDRISWRFVSDEGGARYEIRDPYFDFFWNRGLAPFDLPVAGEWTEQKAPMLDDPFNYTPIPAYLQDATGFVLLNDVLPVTVGAKYRHLIVQFDDRGEIKRVIPLDPIQH